MKSLSLLFADLNKTVSDIQIEHITNDSRAVTKNTLFLAYPGEKSDGRDYIQQAVEKGAVAIAYEPSDDFMVPEVGIPVIAVNNLKINQSRIAARFYDFPSQKIPVIGVTGTNGKTSITNFIAQMFDQCGIIGTMGYGFLNQLKKTVNTTPDGLQLQKIFYELVNQGAKMIAMEVSSHALDQQRVNDVQFHTAVFSNLTQDHLDYHITMEKYRDAKELLFQQPGLKNAVINIDDDAGKYFAEKYQTKLKVITYSCHDKNASIFLRKCTPTEKGFDLEIKTPLGMTAFQLPLIGEFNIENILATMGVYLLCDTAPDFKKLSTVKIVPGRMELVKTNPFIIIDYAHTPDALEKVLKSVRTHCFGKLWCVFGCGGNRDKTKRPIMGAIAEKLSDQVIITNDNPRFEDPATIAAEVLNGMQNKNNAVIELDRAAAIRHAMQWADKKDWIVIAGKGHETEQVIGDQALHHSDQECVYKI